jgi:hypothetical protein
MQFCRDGGVESDNTEQGHQLGVLETDELTYIYLSGCGGGNVALWLYNL